MNTVHALAAALTMSFILNTSATYGSDLLRKETQTSTYMNTLPFQEDLPKKQVNLCERTFEKSELPTYFEMPEPEVEETQEFVVTAYDLSVQSCGKSTSHPDYGLTASGVSLKGETLESARAIAVDPGVIPLGSKVKLEFVDERMQKYDGIYTAVDTGSAIKGNRIDLFVGDFNSDEASELAMKIGVKRATVTIL